MNFRQCKITWDDVHIPMQVFPTSKRDKYKSAVMEPEPTAAEVLFYDLIEEDLEDDITLPTCDMTNHDASWNDELMDSEDRR